MSARQEFSHKAHHAIMQIPYGKVTSYGHIARLIGFPRHARHIGVFLRETTDPEIPWQRVVNAQGVISQREGGGTHIQAQRLREEGVAVTEEPFMNDEFVGGTGGRVNLRLYGWFPLSLPDPWIEGPQQMPSSAGSGVLQQLLA